MADVAILNPQVEAAPTGYTIPGAQEIILKSVKASYDGTGAAGNYVPVLQFVAPNGTIVSECPLGSTVTAGDDVDVTWFPRGGVTSGSTPSATGNMSLLGPYAVAYNAAGLANGVTVYTPTIGDWLFDAWIEILTPWDGTTPFGDLGFYTGGINTVGGFWNSLTDPGLNMTLASTATGTLYWNDPIAAPAFVGGSGSGNNTIQQALSQFGIDGGEYTWRVLPARFTTTDPLIMVVSQDGTKGGADPGSTQGLAHVYLVVAAP
jgi:hypothetical protein